jgi:hypothetical protein
MRWLCWPSAPLLSWSLGVLKGQPYRPPLRRVPVFSRQTGFINSLPPREQRDGITSHRPTPSAHRESTTTFYARHARKQLWRDRVNTLRAAMRSCTRRQLSRQPIPVRETRIVKPCRLSAATDPRGGPPRSIIGEATRQRTPAVRGNEPAQDFWMVSCRFSVPLSRTGRIRDGRPRWANGPSNTMG